ncbi:replication protein A 70 kDa DNA-binding subunit B [Tanacetum coccineum]
MISQFDSLLKEGESVNLSNFYVVKNNAPYKVANYPFKINFYKKTKVKAIQSVFSSMYGLSFLPFTEFVEDNVTEDQIINLIGHVVAVGDVVHGERKCKKNRRMVVELTDIEFRVQVRVSDDSACASFLMFDQDVFNIVDRSAVDVSMYNLINNYAVYTVGRITSSEMHIKSFIKLYADEMAEVKDVNKDGYDTNVDNEEPILETTHIPMLETSTSPKVYITSIVASKYDKSTQEVRS